MSTPLPRRLVTPLELVRLDDVEVDELEHLLEQLARAPRAAHQRPWELAGGRHLELATQLVVTSARQARVGAGGGGAAEPAHQRHVPFVAPAADVAEQLHGHLATWVARTLRTDAADAPTGPRRPAPATLDTPDLASWLLTRLHTLTWRPGSTRAELPELRRLIARALKLVDRPADRWYAGPCSTPLRDTEDRLVIVDGAQAYCEADLYARPRVPVVICRACGATHRVEQRRAELLRLARNRLERAVDVSRALTSLGQPVTPDRIRQWKRRGLLVPHGQDAGGDPLYRVGDVIDLLTAAAVRRSRTTTKETRSA